MAEVKIQQSSNPIQTAILDLPSGSKWLFEETSAFGGLGP